MVCFRWPEPRKSNKKQKTKLQTTCPQSQTRAPMGSAVLVLLFFFDFRGFCIPNGVCSFVFFVFCFFEVSAWFALLQMASSKRDCLFTL